MVASLRHSVVAGALFICTYLFCICSLFSCTVVLALYIGLRYGGAGVRGGRRARGRGQGALDAARVRRLRQQVQAQGVAATAHEVRVPQAAELQVPLLRLPRLPETQLAAARETPAQRPAREGRLRVRMTARPTGLSTFDPH